MSEDSQNIDTACLDESYKDLNLELQGVLLTVGRVILG